MDAKLTAYGAFVAAEWALQIMDDKANAAEYARLNYKNNISLGNMQPPPPII